jgi:hypothetical protein
MPSDLPFTGRTNRFVTYYSHTEDLPRAAKMASLTLAEAKALYRIKEVRQEIERRLEKIHDEQATLYARAELLTERKTDAAVVSLLETAQGDLLLKTAALSYKKLGLLSEKMEHSGAGGGPLVFTLKRIVGAS